MKRVLLALALALPLLSLSLTAFDWSSVVAKVAPSVVPLTGNYLLDGQIVTYCTAFSINEAKQYYLSAGHCMLDVDMLIDGKKTWVAFYDYKRDLMVLHGEKGRPALRPSGKAVLVGTEFGAYGFANGDAGASFRSGHISAINHLINDITDSFPDFGDQAVMVLDNGLTGGMSGGPIFDLDGRVVSVSQMTSPNQNTAFGRMLADIMDSTREYWER